MRKIREVLRLKYAVGLAHRRIASACSIGVASVGDYLARAERSGVTWPLPEELDDAALERRLFPESTSARAALATPDFAEVHQELKRKGVTLQLLWHEYTEVHPEGYSYSRYCELYGKWSKKIRVSMRQRHRAGEKAFVDFAGTRPQLTNPRTGEKQEIELFVGVLGASSLTYAEATLDQRLPSWLGANERMLEFFGGCPEILVPDCLKSAVTKACRYEPEVNRSYAELAQHYGAVVIPARARKPKDKAKVEAAVLVVTRWLLASLRNQVFFSLSELNAALRERLKRLNDRPMRELGASRRELFERLDRPALRALPATRFEMRHWKENCTVNIDYHVEVEHNYYSVPHRLRGQKIDACYTASTVELFVRQNRVRVATHRRLYGRGQPSTVAEHMPSSHRAHAEWTPSRLIAWAEKTGPITGRFVAEVLRSWPHPEQGYRSCLGLMRLGRTYGDERLEAACERAERLRSFRFKTVKNILGSGQDRLPLPDDNADAGVRHPRHDNIRGAEYYDEDTLH